MYRYIKSKSVQPCVSSIWVNLRNKIGQMFLFVCLQAKLLVDWSEGIKLQIGDFDKFWCLKTAFSFSPLAWLVVSAERIPWPPLFLFLSCSLAGNQPHYQIYLRATPSAGILFISPLQSFHFLSLVFRTQAIVSWQLLISVLFVTFIWRLQFDFPKNQFSLSEIRLLLLWSELQSLNSIIHWLLPSCCPNWDWPIWFRYNFFNLVECGCYCETWFVLLSLFVIFKVRDLSYRPPGTEHSLLDTVNFSLREKRYNLLLWFHSVFWCSIPWRGVRASRENLSHTL